MKELLFVMLAMSAFLFKGDDVIKTQYTYEYTISNSEVNFSPHLKNDNKDLISVIDYNKSKQKTKDTYYKNGEIQRINSFQYSNDKLVKIVADTSYRYYRTHEDVYYPSKCISCNTHYNKEKMQRTFCTESDENGNEFNFVVINSEGDTIRRSISNYDLHGRRVNTIEYDKEGNMTSGNHSVYSKLDTFYTTNIMFDKNADKYILLETLNYELNEELRLFSTDVLYTNFQENQIDTMKIRIYENEQNQIIKKYYKSPRNQNEEWKVTEYTYEYY